MVKIIVWVAGLFLSLLSAYFWVVINGIKTQIATNKLMLDEGRKDDKEALAESLKSNKELIDSTLKTYYTKKESDELFRNSPTCELIMTNMKSELSKTKDDFKENIAEIKESIREMNRTFHDLDIFIRNKLGAKK